MLVLGVGNNYTNSGGLILGWLNETSEISASISGGTAGLASGDYSSITGGIGRPGISLFNQALGFDSAD